MRANALTSESLASDPTDGSDATPCSGTEIRKASLRVRSGQGVVSNLSGDTPTSEAEILLVMARLGAKIADILSDDP